MAESEGQQFTLSAQATAFVASRMTHVLSECGAGATFEELTYGSRERTLLEMGEILQRELNRKYIGLRHIVVAIIAYLLVTGREKSSIFQFISDRLRSDGYSFEEADRSMGDYANSFLQNTLQLGLEGYCKLTGECIRAEMTKVIPEKLRDDGGFFSEIAETYKREAVAVYSLLESLVQCAVQVNMARLRNGSAKRVLQERDFTIACTILGKVHNPFNGQYD